MELVDINKPWEKKYDPIADKYDILYCFRLILGRYPSKEEWMGHSSHQGTDLCKLVSSYISSAEFRNRNILQASHDLKKVSLKYGFDMYVPADDMQVGKHIFENETWEPHVTTAIKKYLAKNIIFADIGANIGYFSMLAGSVLRNTGKIFAFEPFKENIKLLLVNSFLNKFSNVVIFPFAAADDEKLWFYGNAGTNGNIMPVENDFNKCLSFDTIYSVKLDNCLKNLDRLDLVKIDVEGAEYLSFSGAENLLKKFLPVVFSEFYPSALKCVSNISGEDYLSFFIDLGYKIGVIDENGEIIKYKTDKNKVMDCYNNQKGDHIDIVFMP